LIAQETDSRSITHLLRYCCHENVDDSALPSVLLRGDLVRENHPGDAETSLQNATSPVNHSPGQTTYYVDSTAENDTARGTSPDKAWRSLEPVNSTVFGPGDRILFKAGSRFSGQLRPAVQERVGLPSSSTLTARAKNR